LDQETSTLVRDWLPERFRFRLEGSMSPRIFGATTAFLLVTTFAAGCGGGSSPAAPSPSATRTAEPAPALTGGQPGNGQNPIASTTVLSIPVSFTIQPGGKTAIQACAGEPVTFAGDARVVAHQTMLPDGSLAIDLLHFNGAGAVAVGDWTGTTYRLAGGDSNPIVMPPGGGLTATFAANLLVVGPGGAAKFVAHILQHITITPTGGISVVIDFIDIACR
jgi:hypothetical protein